MARCRISEEEMRRQAAPIMELKVPEGTDPIDYLENYLGAEPTAADEMPEHDVLDETVVINFK